MRSDAHTGLPKSFGDSFDLDHELAEETLDAMVASLEPPDNVLPDAIQDAVRDSDKDSAQAAKRKPAQQGPDPKTLPAKKQKGQAGPAKVWNYVASDDSSEMESN